MKEHRTSCYRGEPSRRRAAHGSACSGGSPELAVRRVARRRSRVRLLRPGKRCLDHVAAPAHQQRRGPGLVCVVCSACVSSGSVLHAPQPAVEPILRAAVSIPRSNDRHRLLVLGAAKKSRHLCRSPRTPWPRIRLDPDWRTSLTFAASRASEAVSTSTRTAGGRSPGQSRSPLRRDRRRLGQTDTGKPIYP